MVHSIRGNQHARTAASLSPHLACAVWRPPTQHLLLSLCFLPAARKQQATKRRVRTKGYGIARLEESGERRLHISGAFFWKGTQQRCPINGPATKGPTSLGVGDSTGSRNGPRCHRKGQLHKKRGYHAIEVMCWESDIIACYACTQMRDDKQNRHANKKMKH